MPNSVVENLDGGDKIEGQIKDGEPHGKGTLYYDNGSKLYEG